MMVAVDSIVGIAATEWIVIVAVTVVDIVEIDVAISGDAAAKGLQGRWQRWRAGGGRCRAPEAPARRTGGSYAAGRYRHAGVEWDSTWRALCHAHRRHHSPPKALHALHPRRELPPGFESDCRELSFFFFFSLSHSRLLSLLSIRFAFDSHIPPSISRGWIRQSLKRDLRQPYRVLVAIPRFFQTSIKLLNLKKLIALLKFPLSKYRQCCSLSVTNDHYDGYVSLHIRGTSIFRHE